MVLTMAGRLARWSSKRWTIVCMTVVSFARRTVAMQIGRLQNCDSSSCGMPRRMQGLDVVFHRMTSSPLEVLVDCKLLQQQLPLSGALVVAPECQPPTRR